MNDVSMLLIYIIGINVFAFILMGVDKRKAERRKYRIPERTFWLLAILGGAIGVIFAMTHYHHKTKHASFKIGMPLVLILNIILAGYLFISMS